MTPEERASAYVSKMEAAIQGQKGSQAASQVACKLVEFGLDQAAAMRVFTEYNARCVPPWSERDLERKLAWAARRTCPKADFADDTTPKTYNQPSGPKSSAWPELNVARRAAILEQGFGVADLMEKSDDFLGSAMDYLRILFPGNPLICCGGDEVYKFDTKPVSQWKLEAHEQQFLNPSPMTDVTGINQEGKPSKHCLGNTGDRRYAVIEFDPEKWAKLPADEQARYGDEVKYTEAKLEEQAGLVIHLSSYAPLVMAVHSAGRSLHSYFFVAGQPEERIHKFYRYAVSLGADPRLHLRSQFARMPEGTRPKGGMKFRQPVYFWKPERIK